MLDILPTMTPLGTGGEKKEMEIVSCLYHVEVTLNLQANAEERKLGLAASIHKCGLTSLAALTVLFWKKYEIKGACSV